MIVLVSIIAGLGLRIVSGRRLRDVARLQLRGETGMLIVLLGQIAIPAIPASGVWARIAFGAWLLTFPVLVGVAWLNRKQPGIGLIGLGLLLNLVVIAANGGMPVSLSAAVAVRPEMHQLVIPVRDFVHVAAGSQTRLIWLADVIPLVGPAWIRSAVSPGDCLLLAGIVGFLTAASTPSSSRQESLQAS